ncbi:hypothetical protein QA640_07085 [Bradyrhizobium sp. CB82]|nr:hypothetical protein [Bradyrhizobium sp. CB82]WFU42231.1 hypothetical protein QA640_07085 [Bradyrhizobium sp. CB82]
MADFGIIAMTEFRINAAHPDSITIDGGKNDEFAGNLHHVRDSGFKSESK